MTTRTEGTTRDGVAVRVEHDAASHLHDHVFIDGVEVKVTDATMLRDGGTRVYQTDQGRLTLPRRLGSDDRTPQWRPT